MKGNVGAAAPVVGARHKVPEAEIPLTHNTEHPVHHLQWYMLVRDPSRNEITLLLVCCLDKSPPKSRYPCKASNYKPFWKAPHIRKMSTKAKKKHVLQATSPYPH